MLLDVNTEQVTFNTMLIDAAARCGSAQKFKQFLNDNSTFFSEDLCYLLHDSDKQARFTTKLDPSNLKTLYPTPIDFLKYDQKREHSILQPQNYKKFHTLAKKQHIASYCLDIASEKDIFTLQSVVPKADILFATNISDIFYGFDGLYNGLSFLNTTATNKTNAYQQFWDNLSLLVDPDQTIIGESGILYSRQREMSSDNLVSGTFHDLVTHYTLPLSCKP